VIKNNSEVSISIAIEMGRLWLFYLVFMAWTLNQISRHILVGKSTGVPPTFFNQSESITDTVLEPEFCSIHLVSKCLNESGVQNVFTTIYARTKKEENLPIYCIVNVSFTISPI
jgi:hypothetical protein